MRRKKQTRTPHPDPARELDLRRILDLRASIDRRADLITQYRREISRLLEAARNTSSSQRIGIFLAECKVLDERIGAAEDAIAATGEKIAVLQAAMEPDDLAFL
jgi:hypothetical protein